MLVAYLTPDEVNVYCASRMATRCDLVLYPVAPVDLPLEVQPDAWVYDLDFLTGPLREQVFAELQGGRVLIPTAVHSYGLDRRLARALARRGIIVGRRLGPRLFRRLARRVRRFQDRTPQGK